MGGGEGQPQRFARHRALRHQSRDFLSSAAPARRLSMEPPMPETEPQAKIVLTTCATPDEAARLGRTLVEERLAACATLIPAVHSIYRWQGQVESATETLLLLKTGPAQIPLSKPACTRCTATRRRNSLSCPSKPAAAPTSTGFLAALETPAMTTPSDILAFSRFPIPVHLAPTV